MFYACVGSNDSVHFLETGTLRPSSLPTFQLPGEGPHYAVAQLPLFEHVEDMARSPITSEPSLDPFADDPPTSSDTQSPPSLRPVLAVSDEETERVLFCCPGIIPIRKTPRLGRIRCLRSIPFDYRHKPLLLCGGLNSFACGVDPLTANVLFRFSDAPPCTNALATIGQDSNSVVLGGGELDRFNETLYPSLPAISTSGRHRNTSPFLFLYDLTTTRGIRSIEPIQTFGDESHSWTVTSLDYNSTHRVLFSCSFDRSIKMWDLRTSKSFSPRNAALFTTTVTKDPPLSIVSSENGHSLFVGVKDHIIEFDVRNLDRGVMLAPVILEGAGRVMSLRTVENKLICGLSGCGEMAVMSFGEEEEEEEEEGEEEEEIVRVKVSKREVFDVVVVRDDFGMNDPLAESESDDVLGLGSGRGGDDVTGAGVMSVVRKRCWNRLSKAQKIGMGIGFAAVFAVVVWYWWKS